MRKLRSALLWLTLASVTYGMSIRDTGQSGIPSNLEGCNGLQAMQAEYLDFAGIFGSLTGFVDYAATDKFLHFLDEYVGAGLQSVDLRNTLQYHFYLDFNGIDTQINSIYNQIANN